MKLNLHARIEIALAAALLLGSCGGSGGYNADDAYDLADVARANSVNALSQISALESRLSDIENQVKVNEQNIDVAFTNAEADRRVANGNAELYNNLKNVTLDRLNRIEQRLGM